MQETHEKVLVGNMKGLFLVCPEDGGNKFFRNVANVTTQRGHIPEDFQSSRATLWKPQITHEDAVLRGLAIYRRIILKCILHLSDERIRSVEAHSWSIAQMVWAKFVCAGSIVAPPLPLLLPVTTARI
jgi:hypothetical protein